MVDKKPQLPPLLPRPKRFVMEYCKDWDRDAAVIRAGFSANGAHTTASRLLADPRIIALIDIEKEKIAKRNDVSVDWLIRQYKRIVEQDIRKLYHEDGTMLLPHEFDDDTAFTITSLEVKHGKGGSRTMKAHRADQLRALDSLAKYKKMFSDDPAKDTNITIKFVGGLPTEGDDTK